MRARALSTALLLAALAACGESGTGPGDAELSRAELAALHRAILGVGTGVAGDASANVQASHSGAQAAESGSFQGHLVSDHPCPAGGRVAVAGTVGGSWDAQARTAQLQSEISIGYTACGVRADDGGIITLNGDPDIDLSLTASSDASGLTALRITERGAFTWAKDGSSGRCTVDVTAELVAGTEQVRLSGTFCGWRVDGTVENAG
jgi:hypothetical protein